MYARLAPNPFRLKADFVGLAATIRTVARDVEPFTTASIARGYRQLSRGKALRFRRRTIRQASTSSSPATMLANDPSAFLGAFTVQLAVATDATPAAER